MRFQVGVQVAVEGVGRLWTQVGVDAADGQVHPGQAPGGGVGFLPIDGNVAVCQSSPVNAPPLLGNTAPGIFGNDAPPFEWMQVGKVPMKSALLKYSFCSF
jgi:hypothetical protein